MSNTSKTDTIVVLVIVGIVLAVIYRDKLTSGNPNSLGKRVESAVHKALNPEKAAIERVTHEVATVFKMWAERQDFKAIDQHSDTKQLSKFGGEIHRLMELLGTVDIEGCLQDFRFPGRIHLHQARSSRFR